LNENCDICGAAPLAPWIDVSLCGVYDAGISVCGSCGFRQIRPRLSRGEIAALYRADYFDPSSPAGFRDYARQQQRHEREAVFLARRLASIGDSGRLLEIGCALGFLLDALRRRSGWEVEGVDISPLAAHFARQVYGLSVFQGTLAEARFPDGRFDFVVAKDVLEHVAHPREFLLETHRLLAPGGCVLIVTPNGEANLRPLAWLAGRESAGRLPLLDQGHLSFFGLGHLRRLFDECGFECVRARTIGVRRGLRALGYLPRKARTLRNEAAGKPRPGGGHVPPSRDEDEAALADLSHRLAEEIGRRRTGMRTWAPYVWYRRSVSLLDTLPAWTELGNDFEFLLRKRPA
jgi:SAM-dependent methyltransferase